MDDNKLWKPAKARVEFKEHLRKYLFVNILLWFIWMVVNYFNRSDSWSFPWPIYFSLAWGIALGLHYYKVYTASLDNPIKREHEKLKKKDPSNKER